MTEQQFANLILFILAVLGMLGSATVGYQLGYNDATRKKNNE
jgi:ABC-type cobalt transport system substrate-binding protein